MEAEERLMQFRDDCTIRAYRFEATAAFTKIAGRLDHRNVKYDVIDFPRVRTLIQKLKNLEIEDPIVNTQITVTNKDAPRFCALCWGKCMTWCYQRPDEPLHAMHVICRLFLEHYKLGECVCAATVIQRGMCGWMMGETN
jgi:hypothetical protein